MVNTDAGGSERDRGSTMFTARLLLVFATAFMVPMRGIAQVPIGGEFQVNTYTPLFQIKPSVSPLNAGGFLVAWVSNQQDADSNGVFAQRFGSNGSPLGSEFQVSSYTASVQDD